jgi:hypothetical protein
MDTLALSKRCISVLRILAKPAPTLAWVGLVFELQGWLGSSYRNSGLLEKVT